MSGMMTFQGYSVSLITLHYDPMFLSKTNAPLWFISIIVIYYLLTPVLSYLFPLVRRKPLLTISMACILGLALRLIVYEMHQPWRQEYLFEYMQLSLIGNALFYITGMAVAVGLPSLKKVYRAPYKVGILLFVFWWIVTAVAATHIRELPDVVFVFVLPMMLIAVFTLFVPAINEVKMSSVGLVAYILRPLSYLGRISYQFYVWHWLIILYTWKFMPVPIFFANYFGVLFICLSLTILLAAGTYSIFSPGHQVLGGRKPR
jgi:peptidoglycan/LPS O-acetylase OafA/YrhL